MNEPRTTNEWKEVCRTDWFKKHKATMIIDRPEVIVIGWQNPDSWNYGCRFLIHRRWLTVLGDIGETVYEWGQDISLEFLDSLDFGYFHGKCQASESGRDFEIWDSDKALAYLKEFVQDDEDFQDPAKLAELLEDAERHAMDEKEWCDFFYSGPRVVQDDDYSLAGAGHVPNPRAIGHFIGLKMAIAQLKGSP